MGVFGRSFGEGSRFFGWGFWVGGFWPCGGVLAVSEMTKKDAGGR